LQSRHSHSWATPPVSFPFSWCNFPPPFTFHWYGFFFFCHWSEFLKDKKVESCILIQPD
jgi:hypothetical protein